MNLTLVKYKDPESYEYNWFWTEKQGKTYVHSSPMFSNPDDAMDWHKDLMEKIESARKHWQPSNN